MRCRLSALQCSRYSCDGLAACYLIRERDRLAFVDTGTAHTVPRLLGLIDALGLTPGHVDYVIPTHVHLDHAGGAGR
jgi:glyoxylase-like metal-dependent hydrolase (beta-lactamase superfamily II)